MDILEYGNTASSTVFVAPGIDINIPKAWSQFSITQYNISF